MEHLNFAKKLMKPDQVVFPPIVTELETPWMGEMDAAEYHADTMRMNSSGIRMVLASPYKYSHWLQNDEAEVDPPHYRYGRAAHMMMLEPARFRETFVVEPKFIGKTKDGRDSDRCAESKEMKAEWYEALDEDALVVTADEMTSLMGTAESIFEHKIAKNLLRDGQGEVTLKWTDPDYFIPCRGRIDFLVQRGSSFNIIDFKTSRTIVPGLFASHALDFGYHIQLAFYFDALREYLGRSPESITLVVVEKEPPFEVSVMVMDDEFYEKGQEAYKDALDTYCKCYKHNMWPMRQDKASLLRAPNKIQFYEKAEYDFTKPGATK